MTIQDMARAYAEAWSSGDSKHVVSFYTADGSITINRGDPIIGNAALLEMVNGFHSEFPDLDLSVDHLRIAGNHVVFGWVLKGTHVETKHKVCVSGWEEWDLTDDHKIARSLGWFDVDDYDRQVREGL